MKASPPKDPEAPHTIHFGCDTDDKTPVINIRVKQYMIRIMAIVENSQLLPSERYDRDDFCDIVKKVVAGIRQVVAIDAKCAEKNPKDSICYGNCGIKRPNPSLHRTIYMDTLSNYNDKKKTKLDRRKPNPKMTPKVEGPQWNDEWINKPSQPSTENRIQKSGQQPNQPNSNLNRNQKRNERRKRMKAAKNAVHFQALPFANEDE